MGRYHEDISEVWYSEYKTFNLNEAFNVNIFEESAYVYTKEKEEEEEEECAYIIYKTIDVEQRTQFFVIYID